MGQFISPTTNEDIAGFPPPLAGGSPATAVPSQTPDIVTASVPSTSLYSTSDPLILSPLPDGILLWVRNNKAVPIKIISVTPGDLGLLVAANSLNLVTNGPNGILLIGGTSTSPTVPQTTFDLVRDFGAKVNDPSFDSYPAMQNALTFLSAISLATSGGASTTLIVPGGSYYLVTGSPTLTNSRNLQILASGARFHLGTGVLFGLRLRGDVAIGQNNDGLFLDGYEVEGDGVTVSTGIGTQTPPGPDAPAGRGIRLNRCKVSNTHGGIVFDISNAYGDFTDLDINLAVISDIFGSVTGQGYGIALSGVTFSKIRNSDVTRTQRHGYYISKSVSVDLISCRGSFNRTQDPTPNVQFGCFVIARSSQVNLIDCSGDNNWHGCISIESDDSDLTNACRGFQVVAFRSTNSRDEDVFIGGPSAGVGVSELSDVEIIGGYFARPTGTIGGIGPSANDAPIIRIRHGVRIQIVHPEFVADNNYVVTYSAIVGSSISANPAVLSLIDDVTITGIRGVLSGTNLNLLYLYPPACSNLSAQKWMITDNPISFLGSNQFIFYFAGRGNPNIVLERNGNTRMVTLTQGATVLPDTNAGVVWQVLNITTNAALAFDDPGIIHQGAELKIVITNSSGGAMATPTWAASYLIDLSGGAGSFVKPPNGKTVVVPFVYVGSKYVQSGACSIGV